MLQIVLFEPEIPGNTGNIIRLCANTGCLLHLIKPLGFELEDKKLKRAGLDYHEWADVKIHENYADFLRTEQPKRIFALTTKGSRHYHTFATEPDDFFLFGPESRGLPADILAMFNADTRLRLPMMPDSRSLNLSNTVAVVVYDAWRQLNFIGGQ